MSFVSRITTVAALLLSLALPAAHAQIYVDADNTCGAQDGLTIYGGFDGTGSGNECSPTLRRVVFAGNAATDGGGALYDVLGRRVKTVRAEAEPGRHTLRLPVQPLAGGVYVLRLRAGHETRSRKLTVVQ